jgi:hypothetical protein
VAGAEADGFAGDGEDATKGIFNEITRLKVDADGNVFLVDSGVLGSEHRTTLGVRRELVAGYL